MVEQVKEDGLPLCSPFKTGLLHNATPSVDLFSLLLINSRKISHHIDSQVFLAK